MKQIRISEIAGKTVKGMASAWGCLLIAFDDGTYINFHALNGYSGCDATLEEDGIDISNFSDETLIRLGIAGAIELEDIRRKALWARKEEIRLQEKATYKRLKLKFEGEL